MIRLTPPRLVAIFMLAGILAGAARGADAPDQYSWLEDVMGDKPLAWVKAQDEATAKRLQALPTYAGLYKDALTVLDNQSRIPQVEPHGGSLYNLWQDKDHPRGLWRRTTLSEFRKKAPAWETVIDIERSPRPRARRGPSRARRFCVPTRRAAWCRSPRVAAMPPSAASLKRRRRSSSQAGSSSPSPSRWWAGPARTQSTWGRILVRAR